MHWKLTFTVVDSAWAAENDKRQKKLYPSDSIHKA